MLSHTKLEACVDCTDPLLASLSADSPDQKRVDEPPKSACRVVPLDPETPTVLCCTIRTSELLPRGHRLQASLYGKVQETPTRIHNKNGWAL